LKVLREVVKLIKNKKSIIIIDGYTQTGKTTLSKFLKKKLREKGFSIKVIHTDKIDYYKKFP
jgi:uridine kinase